MLFTDYQNQDSIKRPEKIEYIIMQKCTMVYVDYSVKMVI